jgi:hypothetical protein
VHIHHVVTEALNARQTSRLFLAAPTQGTKPFYAAVGAGIETGMGRVTLVFVMVVVLAVIAGAVFLATWNFNVPRATVEKVLPDGRFPK